MSWIRFLVTFFVPDFVVFFQCLLLSINYFDAIGQSLFLKFSSSMISFFQIASSLSFSLSFLHKFNPSSFSCCSTVLSSVETGRPVYQASVRSSLPEGLALEVQVLALPPAIYITLNLSSLCLFFFIYKMEIKIVILFMIILNIRQVSAC